MALRGLLLSVAFLDELASGVSPVAAPELEGLFGLSHLGAAGATLVALAALGFIEPVLLLLADRHPRRWFLCGGLPDPAKTKERLAEVGIHPFDYADKAHSYYRAPGGPVFRLAPQR